MGILLHNFLCCFATESYLNSGWIHVPYFVVSQLKLLIYKFHRKWEDVHCKQKCQVIWSCLSLLLGKLSILLMSQAPPPRLAWLTPLRSPSDPGLEDIGIDIQLLSMSSSLSLLVWFLPIQEWIFCRKNIIILNLFLIFTIIIIIIIEKRVFEGNK